MWACDGDIPDQEILFDDEMCRNTNSADTSFAGYCALLSHAERSFIVLENIGEYSFYCACKYKERLSCYLV